MGNLKLKESEFENETPLISGWVECCIDHRCRPLHRSVFEGQINEMRLGEWLRSRISLAHSLVRMNVHLQN